MARCPAAKAKGSSSEPLQAWVLSRCRFHDLQLSSSQAQPLHTLAALELRRAAQRTILAYRSGQTA